MQLKSLIAHYSIFPYNLINTETPDERKQITDYIMLLAKQRLVLKEDEYIKDFKRHREIWAQDSNQTTEKHKKIKKYS